jgi:hypothetical protein
LTKEKATWLTLEYEANQRGYSAVIYQNREKSWDEHYNKWRYVSKAMISWLGEEAEEALKTKLEAMDYTTPKITCKVELDTKLPFMPTFLTWENRAKLDKMRQEGAPKGSNYTSYNKVKFKDLASFYGQTEEEHAAEHYPVPNYGDEF